jgi:hypothetical protein
MRLEGIPNNNSKCANVSTMYNIKLLQSLKTASVGSAGQEMYV